MAVIMVVIIMAVTITLLLIPGTGIKSIITTITGTGPRPLPITDLIINMEPDRQIAPLQGHPIVIDRQQEHLIVHPPAHLIDPPREFPTTVHPQGQPIDLPHQMFLREAGVPGVVEAIVEVVVAE